MNDAAQTTESRMIASAPGAVLDFWFGTPDDPDHALPRKAWFSHEPAFDEEIRRRFAGTYERAVAGDFARWRDDGAACLALVLVFDQFPRNMFRADPRAFATDPQARDLARHALASGYDRRVPPVHRKFFYLPFEHSEDRADQELSVRLFQAMEPHPDRDEGIRYAERHREIIRLFGRFPHRNAVLGRESTPEEFAFLKQPNSSF